MLSTLLPFLLSFLSFLPAFFRAPRLHAFTPRFCVLARCSYFCLRQPEARGIALVRWGRSRLSVGSGLVERGAARRRTGWPTTLNGGCFWTRLLLSALAACPLCGVALCVLCVLCVCRPLFHVQATNTVSSEVCGRLHCLRGRPTSFAAQEERQKEVWWD